MRFLFFIFLCFHVFLSHSQVSKTTSYAYGSQVSTPYVDHHYTTNHSKYIATLQNMPTGAISRGIGITKLNECDEIEWSNIYVKHAQPMDKAQIIQEKNSDNIFVTGLYRSQGQKFIYVLKLDPLGNVLFSKYYDFGNYTLSYYYTNYATNNGLVISANYAPLGGGDSYTVLMSIDKDGNLLHSNRLYHTYYGISCLQLSDYTYLHRTAQQLYMTDVDGQVHWAIQFQSPLFYGNAFDILKTGNGYAMVVNHTTTSFLIKVDLNGQILWKTDQKDLGLYPPQVVETNDNQLLMCTYTTYNGNSVPLIMTYDSNGNLIKEEVLTDLGINVGYLLSVSKSPNGNINLTYLSNNNTHVYIQDVEHSLCKEEVFIPEVENTMDTTYTILPSQKFPLPLTSVIDVELQIVDLYVEDSIRCEGQIILDTTYTTGLIDCETEYIFEGSYENSTYYWPQDGSTDEIKTLDSVGVYQVDIENCFSKTTQFITIESICGCTLNLPNAFTPNGDMLNDVFKIIDNCGINYFTINIYDRWGKRIFHSNSIETSWDGTYNGNMVKSDYYHYKIEYTPISTSSNVSPKQLEGAVMVIY